MEKEIDRVVSRFLSLRGRYRRILWPLGGAREIGRSCFFLTFGGKKFIIDCGAKGEIDRIVYPYFLALSHAISKGKLGIDAIFITHAHLDHVGGLPKLLEYVDQCPPIYMTRATRKAAEIILKDEQNVRMDMGLTPICDSSKQEFNLSSLNLNEVNYNEPIDFNNVTATFLDAGHILGSAMILFNFRDSSSSSGKSLLYTGDIKINRTALLNGADLEGLSRADYVVVEGTYLGGELIADTLEEGRKLVTFISKIIGQGGKVLIPVYALGKAQELLALISRAKHNSIIPEDTPIYMFGLARTVTMALREELQQAGVDPQSEIVQKDFKDILPSELDSSIILATPGRMNTGISASLALHVANDPKSGIAVVGYQDEMSPGRMLIDAIVTRKITLSDGTVINLQCNIQRFGISAHSPWDEIMQFLRRYASRSILVHTETKVRPSGVWRFPKNLDVVVLKDIRIRGFSRPEERVASEVEEKLNVVLFKGEIINISNLIETSRKLSSILQDLLSNGILVLTPKLVGNEFQLMVQITKKEQIDYVLRALLEKGFINVSYEETSLSRDVAKEVPFIIQERFSKITSFLGLSNINPPYFRERRLIDVKRTYGIFRPPNTILLDSRLKFDRELFNYVVDHELAHYVIWCLLQKFVDERALKKWQYTEFVEGFAEWVAEKMGNKTWIYFRPDEYNRARAIFDAMELRYGIRKVIEVLVQGATLEEAVNKMASLKIKESPSINISPLMFSEEAFKNFLLTFGGYSLIMDELSPGRPIWFESRGENYIVFITPRFAIHTQIIRRGEAFFAWRIIRVLKPTIRMYSKMLLDTPFIISLSPINLLGEFQRNIDKANELITLLKRNLNIVKEFLNTYDQTKELCEIVEQEILRVKKLTEIKGILNFLKRRQARKILEKLLSIQEVMLNVLDRYRNARRYQGEELERIISRIERLEYLLQELKYSNSSIEPVFMEAFEKIVEEREDFLVIEQLARGTKQMKVLIAKVKKEIKKI